MEKSNSFNKSQNTNFDIKSLQSLIQEWDQAIQQSKEDKYQLEKQVPNLIYLLQIFEKAVEEEEKYKSDFPICNLFKESDQSLEENSHSNIFRFLLDPNEKHLLGLSLIEKILSYFKSDDASRILNIIKKEYIENKRVLYVRTEVSGSESRIDIEFRGSSFLVWIENKTKSDETLKGTRYQTFREWDDLLERAEILNIDPLNVFAIFLTPSGLKPSREKFRSLSYYDISRFLWEISSSEGLKEEIKWTLRQYSEYIDLTV